MESFYKELAFKASRGTKSRSSALIFFNAFERDFFINLMGLLPNAGFIPNLAFGDSPLIQKYEQRKRNHNGQNSIAS
jgi:hypothetical protein